MTNLSDDERAEIVTRRLRYDIAEGLFYWLPRPESDFEGRLPEWEAMVGYRAFEGRFANRPVVPTDAAHAGVSIRFTSERTTVLAHRAAWLLVTGFWPKKLFAIDGDRHNYRVENWHDKHGKTALDYAYLPKEQQLEMEPLWIAAE